MLFLSVQLVEALHEAMIETYGGSSGLRDRGLLESAVSRAENRVHYEPNTTVGQAGASLAWALVKNHAFIDGNKRVGFAALITFLHLNGFQLVCSELEETEMILLVAAGEMEESGWIRWVEANIEEIPSEHS